MPLVSSCANGKERKDKRLIVLSLISIAKAAQMRPSFGAHFQYS